MVEGSCLLRPSVPQGQAANSLELGGRLLANQDRSFKEQEGSVACPESSLHVFVRAFFFFFSAFLETALGASAPLDGGGREELRQSPQRKSSPLLK